jgi:probable F420-dependent oxidoreductase
MPKMGLFAVNMEPTVEPAAAMEIARLAEKLGYESVWAGEHVVVPDPRSPRSPMAPTEPILDPVTTLAFLAAGTSTLRLGTGIVILPQRNPLVLAKELASLDVLSGGRLTFGMGVGYLEEEMRAIGVPMQHRGRRAVEYLEAMRAVWTMDRPAYDGGYISYSGINAYPRPVQKPLPVLMGGYGEAAFRRAVEHANGWYGFRLDLHWTASGAQGLVEASSRYARPVELGPLEISVTPSGPLDPDLVVGYAALGVHRLILMPPPGISFGELEAFVHRNSPASLGVDPAMLATSG